MKTKTRVPDGWYLLTPEGGAWEAVSYRHGKIVDDVREQDADTLRRGSHVYDKILDAIEADLENEQPATLPDNLHDRIVRGCNRLWDSMCVGVSRLEIAE